MIVLTTDRKECILTKKETSGLKPEFFLKYNILKGLYQDPKVFFRNELTYCNARINQYYGNTGCGVFKRGVQN